MKTVLGLMENNIKKKSIAFVFLCLFFYLHSIRFILRSINSRSCPFIRLFHVAAPSRGNKPVELETWCGEGKVGLSCPSVAGLGRAAQGEKVIKLPAPTVCATCGCWNKARFLLAVPAGKSSHFLLHGCARNSTFSFCPGVPR